MWMALIINLLKFVVSIARSWAIIFFLGIRADVVTVFSISAFSNIAYIAPLPAALGSLEALEAFAFEKLGFASPSAVAFTLILRAADILLALVGIFLVFRFSTKWLREKMDL